MQALRSLALIRFRRPATLARWWRLSLGLLTLVTLALPHVISPPVAAASSTVQFAPPANYVTNDQSVRVYTGDFNGDGIPDLLTLSTNQAGNDFVSVLLGNGDGTFRAPTTSPTGNTGQINRDSAVIGDLNGDGKLDVIVSSVSSQQLSVLLGNGDGTFQAPKIISTANDGISMALADFNGDGKLDLAFADQAHFKVAVMLGNGDGTFQPRQDNSVPDAEGVVAGDFNGDHKQDLYVATGGSGTDSILLGNGDGTFQPPHSIGGNNDYEAVADLNGDGKLDLIGPSSVALGNGDGTFQAPLTYTPCSDNNPYFVAVADYNHDGKLDVAVTCALQNVVSINLGNGDGTFQPPVDVPAGTLDQGIAAADFNGDGQPDLATASPGVHGVSVLLNHTDVTPPVTALTIGLPQYSAGGQLFVTSGTSFTLNATDPDSAVKAVAYRVFPQGSTAPAYTTVAGSIASFIISGADGVYELDYFAADPPGNVETAHTQLVTLDNTPPTITLTVPADKATYTLNQAGLNVSYACDDGSGSGVASCAGTQPNDAPLDTSSLGLHTFTVNALDNLGDASSVAHTYGVACPTSGFLPPINANGSSIFKLGRTVPVKVQLTGSCAGLATATLTLYVAQVSNGITGTVMEASSTSAADSGNTFRYDAGGGQYIFNLGTNSLTTGTYQLSIYIGGTNTTGVLLLQVNISLK